MIEIEQFWATLVAGSFFVTLLLGYSFSKTRLETRYRLVAYTAGFALFFFITAVVLAVIAALTGGFSL